MDIDIEIDILTAKVTFWDRTLMLIVSGGLVPRGANGYSFEGTAIEFGTEHGSDDAEPVPMDRTNKNSRALLSVLDGREVWVDSTGRHVLETVNLPMSFDQFVSELG